MVLLKNQVNFNNLLIFVSIFYFFSEKYKIYNRVFLADHEPTDTLNENYDI